MSPSRFAPRRPARRTPGMLVAPIHSGGVGRCTGCGASRRAWSIVVVGAVVGERVVGPQALEHVEALAEAAQALAPVDAVPGELVAGVALAEPDVDAAVRQHVERGDVLGEADGVVQRQQQEVEADPHPFRPGGDGGGEGDDRRRVAVVGEVVLGEPDGVVAERLGVLDEREFVAVDVGEGSSPGRRVAEAEHHPDVERRSVHGPQPCSAAELGISRAGAGHVFSSGSTLSAKSRRLRSAIVVGHAAVAEAGQQTVHVDHGAHVLELAEDLIGRTPRHQADEVVDGALGAVPFQVAGDARVELVALHALVRGGGELVVAHHGGVVLADPLAGHLLGPIGALVADHEPARDRPRRLAAVDLAVDLLVRRRVLPAPSATASGG